MECAWLTVFNERSTHQYFHSLNSLFHSLSSLFQSLKSLFYSLSSLTISLTLAGVRRLAAACVWAWRTRGSRPLRAPHRHATRRACAAHSPVARSEASSQPGSGTSGPLTSASRSAGGMREEDKGKGAGFKSWSQADSHDFTRKKKRYNLIQIFCQKQRDDAVFISKF